ncbi:MAG: oligosaccharide flippase family protein [Dehalococcoidia bacterium]
MRRKPTAPSPVGLERAPDRPADILDTSGAGPAAIRGGILRVGAYVGSVGLGVVAAALLLRHLGPSDFGRYTAVLSLVLIVTTVTEAGMTAVGVRQYSTLVEPERTSLMRNLLGLRLLLTSAGGLGAIAFAAAVGYDQTMVLGTALAASGMVIGIVQATYGVALQSELKFGWFSALELVRQVATLILVGALVALGATLLPFLVVPAVAALVVLVLTVPLVRGYVSLAPSYEPQHWRDIALLTVPFAAANAVGAVYGYLSVILLSLLSSAEETGFFGAAFRIFLVLAAVASLMVATGFPVLARAARDDRARLRYALSRLWEMCVIVGVGLSVATAVGAEVIIDVVAGPGYEPAADALRILAVAMFASFVLATWGFGLLSLGRYRAILVANVLALAASATVNALLTPDHGALGAAYATLVGETVLAAGYGFSLIVLAGFRPPLGTLPKVALATAASVPFALVPNGVVGLVGCILAYAVVLLLTRALPPEVIGALRSRVHD